MRCDVGSRGSASKHGGPSPRVEGRSSSAGLRSADCVVARRGPGVGVRAVRVQRRCRDGMAAVAATRSCDSRRCECRSPSFALLSICSTVLAVETMPSHASPLAAVHGGCRHSASWCPGVTTHAAFSCRTPRLWAASSTCHGLFRQLFTFCIHHALSSCTQVQARHCTLSTPLRLHDSHSGSLQRLVLV